MPQPPLLTRRGLGYPLRLTSAVSQRTNQMTVKDLQSFYDYSYWANKHLFQVISQLPPEQFTRSVGGGFGSIRNTLVHILSAEWGWLGRCGGPERGPRLNAADYPTLESVTVKWRTVEGYVREFVSNLKEEDITRNAEYLNDAGEKRAMTLGETQKPSAVQWT